MSSFSPRDALPQTIATKRLTLRAPMLADLDQLVALLDNPSVSFTTAVIPIPYTEADGRFFIEHTGTEATLRAYAIVDADSQLIGVVSFKFQDGKPPELGYWIGEPFWSQGYVSEAVAGLLDAARATGLFPRINARALSSNGASLRVLEKAGFTVTEITTSLVERHLGQPIHVFGWEDAARTSMPATIATPRLTLITPELRHVPAIAKLANNQRVNATLARLPFPYYEEHAEFFITKIARQPGEWAYLVLLDGEVIGVAGLNFVDGELPELGYWLGEPYWGFGYATEAATAIVATARATGKFAGLRSRALQTNLASLGVLRKSGFVVVGHGIEQNHALKGQAMTMVRQDFVR